MSKRKSMDDLRDAVDKIRELLPQIKHTLSLDAKALQASSSSALLDQLARVSANAEIIHGLKRLSGQAWIDVADELDREGTVVWNASVGLKEREGLPKKTYAAVRLAGFRLIQAGLELEPKEDALVHILRLACKVSAALVDADDHALASRTLTSAAAYEEALRSAPSVHDGGTQTVEQRALERAHATTMYFRSRMVAAWKEGSTSVAQFMLQKITSSDTELLFALKPQDLEGLIRDILDIGKSLLRPVRTSASQVRPSQDRSQGSSDRHAVDPRKAQEAVEYLQRAYELAEKADERPLPASEEPSVLGASMREALRDAKRSTLRTLARAYYLSHSVVPENLARAEATLEELLRDSGTSPGSQSRSDTGREDDETMRYMLLVVRRKRGAPAGQIEEALRSIIDGSPCTEAAIKSVMLEVRSEPSNPSFFVAMSQHLLAHVLKPPSKKDLSRPKEDVVIGHVLLSIIFQATRDTDLRRGMAQLTTAFDAVFNASFELDKTCSGACLTLLWQAGDRQYASKHFGAAASFFELGTHRVFHVLGSATTSKCCRRAAICHLGSQEFARAAQIVRKGDADGREAGTWYVLFLVAVEQGIEDEAARAAERMVDGEDFDPRMLRLAMQMASERGMRALLWAVLDLLLRAVRGKLGPRLGRLDFEVEGITLARCLIRMGREELNSAGADAEALVDSLAHHLTTAKAIVEEAAASGRGSTMVKDLSWLWRAAYNLAVDSCSAWGGTNERTARLFGLAVEFLELYVKAVIVDPEPDAWSHLVVSMFSAVSGKVFAIRERIAAGDRDEAYIRTLLLDIVSCKNRVGDILRDGKISLANDVDRANGFVRYLRLFEIELLCVLGEWAQLSDTVQEAAHADSKSYETFEAMADIVWTRADCPMSVLSLVLETILHASLDAGALSIGKFSRWLRVLISILLERGNDIDRVKAVGYVEQAAGVMADHADDTSEDGFPLDERQWLMATTYNTGLDCLQASLIDEARRWVESSMTIARLVSGGTAALEKISETYRRILTRAERVVP